MTIEAWTWVIATVAILCSLLAIFFARLTSRRLKEANASYARADKNYAKAEEHYARTAEYYARTFKANEITAKINRGEPLTDEENAFLDEPRPLPCPICGGSFPNPASQGQITCENGHVVKVVAGMIEVEDES